METSETISDQETSLKLLESNEVNVNFKNEAPSDTKPPPLFFSKRLLVTVLLFFSFINFQILRNNMNIAIVEMTSTRNKTIEQGNINITIVQLPEFPWDSPTVGLIISLVNFGGLLGFLNGFIIEKFGASVVTSVSMLLAGVLTLLHPVALYQSFYVFLACRLLTGLFEGGFYASSSEVFARWFPVKERSTLIAYSFNGTNTGVAIVYPFCGFLAHTWGWQMVFYVTGALSVILSLLFFVYVKNHPSQDKRISRAELAYILRDNDTGTMGHEKCNQSIGSKFINVFKPILTSGPVWAMLILLFTFMWMATIITACLPLYIKDRTGKKIDEIGYLSSIPNTIYIFLVPVLGVILDFWKNHSSMTLTKIHKIMICGSFASAMILFAGVTFFSDLTTSLVFFVLIQIFTCPVPLLIPIINMCMAPNHVSHTVSIGSNFFLLGAIASQTVSGFMTKNHTLQEWNNVFFLSSGVALFGGLAFLILGSSEAQPWSMSPSGKPERRLSSEQLKTKDSVI